MRNTSFTFGTVNTDITYPGDSDGICWKNDNFISEIKFLNGTYPFSVRIIITNIATTLSNTLQYTTLTNHIIFDLRDNIIDIIDDSVKVNNFVVSVELLSHSLNTFTYNIQVIEGKSFLTTPHGTSSVILINNADELSDVQIYAQFPSNATIDNTTYSVDKFKSLDLSSIITTEGNYKLCLEPIDVSSLPPVITFVKDEFLTPYSSKIIWGVEEQKSNEYYKGGLWNRTNEEQHCIDIIYEEGCDDYPNIELKYINTDGCDRYVMGKLLTEHDGNKYSTIANKFNDIRNINDYYVTENSKTLNVGIKDIPAGLHFNDIVYSEKLWIRDYNNQWISCVLKSFDVEYNNEDNDYIVEIIVNKI